MVGEETVVKAEAALKGAEALVQVKSVEIEELELRREQARRRAIRIKEVLALADRVKAAGSAAPPVPDGGPAVR
jgi:hypothetical protein